MRDRPHVFRTNKRGTLAYHLDVVQNEKETFLEYMAHFAMATHGINDVEESSVIVALKCVLRTSLYTTFLIL